MLGSSTERPRGETDCVKGLKVAGCRRLDGLERLTPKCDGKLAGRELRFASPS
jgi:hypothetical protein